MNEDCRHSERATTATLRRLGLATNLADVRLTSIALAAARPTVRADRAARRLPHLHLTRLQAA
jgi:hypothetical protein